MNKIVFIFFTMIIWNSQIINAQSKVFFSQIYLGDNLEKCIANGLVQSTGGATAWNTHDWELTDYNIKSYFPRTGVAFDSKNQVKEIELLASNYLHHESKSDVDVKRSFNYILRYFTQQYSGMRQKQINTKDTSSCLYNVGTEYVWETSDLIIQVKFYDCVHDGNKCKGFQGTNYCPDAWMDCGTFTRVNIIRK